MLPFGFHSQLRHATLILSVLMAPNVVRVCVTLAANAAVWQPAAQEPVVQQLHCTTLHAAPARKGAASSTTATGVVLPARHAEAGWGEYI